MPQFFIKQPIVQNTEITISGGDARHILKVLRLKKGDWIRLSDGLGATYEATIISASGTKVTALVEGKIDMQLTSNAPTLALAIIKGDRFEWALEKVVELGVKDIIPFESQRSVPQYAKNATTKKITRWQKIAEAAAKQSGLPFMPKISDIKSFDKIITSKLFDSKFIFFEGEKTFDIKNLWDKRGKESSKELLIVGPEGGFGPEEIKKAKASGCLSASLGRQILRVETAAVVAVALWQYEIGNLNLRSWNACHCEKP